MRSRSVTVVDLVLVLIVVVVLGALLPSWGYRSIRCSKVTSCSNNLKQLWTMQSNYAVQYGGPEKVMSDETGDDFWLKLSRPPTVLIDQSLRDIYACSVRGESLPIDATHYRGPSRNVSRYSDGDPVGADVDGNHGLGEGGNVIRKSGDVSPHAADDPIWALASVKTRGGTPVPLTAWSSRKSRDWWKKGITIVSGATLFLLLLTRLIRLLILKPAESRPSLELLLVVIGLGGIVVVGIVG